jgi:hypothetical protein
MTEKVQITREQRIINIKNEENKVGWILAWVHRITFIYFAFSILLCFYKGWIWFGVLAFLGILTLIGHFVALYKLKTSKTIKSFLNPYFFIPFIVLILACSLHFLFANNNKAIMGATANLDKLQVLVAKYTPFDENGEIKEDYTPESVKVKKEAVKNIRNYINKLDNPGLWIINLPDDIKQARDNANEEYNKFKDLQYIYKKIASEKERGAIAGYEISIGFIFPQKIEILDYKDMDQKRTENRIIRIADNAFLGYEDLESVSIPLYLDTIGSNAFKDCINLSKIFEPESDWDSEDMNVLNSRLTRIGSYAFENCPKIKTMKIQGKVSVVGNEIFKNSKMTKIQVKFQRGHRPNGWANNWHTSTNDVVYSDSMSD